jgi:hypothetical protein
MALTEDMKGEATLLPSPYKSSHTEEGLRAFAKRLQTLIIMEPGTLPNCTQAGVGIGLYVAELADYATLSEITQRINSQVEKYLPNSVIRSMEVKIVTDPNTGNPMLAVIATLAEAVQSKKQFGLTFRQSSTTASKDNVVSDFYF